MAGRDCLAAFERRASWHKLAHSRVAQPGDCSQVGRFVVWHQKCKSPGLMRRSFLFMAGLVLSTAACAGSGDPHRDGPALDPELQEGPSESGPGLDPEPPGGPSPEQARLAESRESWAALKAESGSSYRYTAMDSSWTGYRWQTTVEVVQDHVARRSYTSETDTGVAATSWLEEQGALGSNPGGAPPLTIEELYDMCASEVLTQDPTENWITLTFQSDGLLQHCSYFPKNCADDCAVGVSMATLEFID